MSHQTESILKSAIGRFRSMSPAERRAAIRAATNRAMQAGRGGPKVADVRVWDLGEQHVFGFGEMARHTTCIRVPTTEASTVTVVQAVHWSPVAFESQVFLAAPVESTTGLVAANNNIEYRPTFDLVVAA